MGKSKNFSHFPINGWMDIYNVFKDLYLSAFKWDGLPKGINSRFMELTLFENGKVAFFNDEIVNQYLALKFVMHGYFDVYGEPKELECMAVNGARYIRTNHIDSVVIYNNNVRDTPQKRLELYAKRIYNIERTIDVNINAQKTPMLFRATKETELTIKNILKQYDDFEPFVVTDSELDGFSTGVLNATVPFVADKLEDAKRKLWNEALSFIGIENNYSEKNERLTANEVLISNSLAVACRNAKLEAREVGAREIEKIFGINISVKPNNVSVMDAIIESKQSGILDGGGDENG